MVSRGPAVARAAHLVVLVADPPIIGAMKRELGAELEVEITAPTTLEFQIAVAPHPNAEVSESLSFVLDGNPVQPLEISGVHGNRIHKLDAPVGNLTVDLCRDDLRPERPGSGDRSGQDARRVDHIGGISRATGLGRIVADSNDLAASWSRRDRRRCR